MRVLARAIARLSGQGLSWIQSSVIVEKNRCCRIISYKLSIWETIDNKLTYQK